MNFLPPSVSAWLVGHVSVIALAVAVLSMLDAIARGVLRLFPTLGPYLMRVWPRFSHVMIAVGHLIPGIAPALRRFWMAAFGVPFPLPDLPSIVVEAPPAAKVPTLPLLMALLVLGIFGCGASQVDVHTGGGGTVSPDGTVTWQVGADVTIRFAMAAIPAIKPIVDSRQDLTSAQRADIDRGLILAQNTLGLAGTALETYRRAPTIQNQCQVHFYLEQAVTATVELVTLLQNSGVAIDPAAMVALSALGTADDMLYPGCATPADGGLMAAHTSALDRVTHALARRL